MFAGFIRLLRKKDGQISDGAEVVAKSTSAVERDDVNFRPDDPEIVENLGYVPTPVRKLKDIFGNQPSLSGILPYALYHPAEKIFVNDDNIGFCLEVRPQTGASEELVRILSSMFTSCPAHTGIQFILYGSPNLTAQFKDYANRRPIDEDYGQKYHEWGRSARNTNIYRELARSNIEFLKKGTRKSLFKSIPFLIRNYRLIISVTIPGADSERNREALIRLRDIFVGTLQSAHFPAIVWGVKDLIKYLKEVLNPQEPVDDFEPDYDDGRLIKAQVINTDTKVLMKEDGIVFRNARNSAEVRYFSVKNYPASARLWEMGDLIGDFYQISLRYPCPFMLVTGIQILDYESTKNKVTIKSARATTNAESPMARFMPDMKDKKRDWDIALQALSSGESLVHMYNQVVIFSDTENAVSAEQSVRAILRSKNFDVTNDTCMQPQSLHCCLPMALSKDLHSDLKKMMRITTKTTSNAINMTPMIAEWSGTVTPTMMFFGKRGQLMYLDFDDNKLGNQNCVVTGASGSGKSFVVNNIVTSYRGGRNAKVRIFDVGRSYEKLCELLGGQFLEFKPETNICLNPFSMVSDFTEEMALLRPMVSQMAMPTTKPDDLQNAILDEAIRAVWDRHRNEMTVTHIAEYLREMATKGDGGNDWVTKLAERAMPNIEQERNMVDGKPSAPDGPRSTEDYMALLMHAVYQGGGKRDQRMFDLARMLYPYTKDGTYGRYFEGKANIDFDNDLVVLELDDLSSKKDLQAVVLFILIYAIQQELYLGDRKRKVLIIIDEAWQLIGGSGSVSEFIENGFRRARKYGGSFLVASQSVADMYKSDGGTAIMANSDWHMLLRQNKDALEMLLESKKFNLSDYEKRMVLALHTEQGLYSEAFVRVGNQRGVFTFIPDPFSQLLFSSKHDDYSSIKSRMAIGMDISSAIRSILQERGITT